MCIYIFSCVGGCNINIFIFFLYIIYILIKNYIHDEIISNSRERALSMSSQSQASSYGGYDSPHLSRSSGIHDECIGCNDPEMEIQLKRHLSELESLI